MENFLILLIACLIFFHDGLYAEDTNLNQELISAITLNKITKERQKDAGEVIRLFIKAGYVARKPELRSGYTDYRLLRKPIFFLGHQLLVIQEEYIGKWAGCCVSPGIGIVVKAKGDYSKLKSFALSNGCSFEENQDDIRIFIKYPSFRLDKNEKYIKLACKERDLPDSFWASSDKTIYSVKEYLSTLRSNGKDIILTSTLIPFTEIDIKENCIALSKSLGKGVWRRLTRGFKLTFSHKEITFKNNEINTSLGCLKGSNIMRNEIDTRSVVQTPIHTSLSLKKNVYEIEIAHNDELFVINGEKFSAQTYCLGWYEGDKVMFINGDANGICTTAKLLNLRNEKICTVWCE